MIETHLQKGNGRGLDTFLSTRILSNRTVKRQLSRIVSSILSLSFELPLLT